MRRSNGRTCAHVSCGGKGQKNGPYAYGATVASVYTPPVSFPEVPPVVAGVGPAPSRSSLIKADNRTQLRARAAFHGFKQSGRVRA